MTQQEAKDILTLFRPGTTDSQDPEFTTALELARQDPALSRWLAEHCARQEAIRAKFRQIPVPDGLREQILSERKVRTTLWARHPAVGWVLVTAGVMLLGILATSWRSPSRHNDFSTFQNRMARTVQRQYPHMDLLTSDLQQIQQHLAGRGRGDYSLPAGLAKTRPTGCALLQWHGQPISMICFNSGRTATRKDPDLFLFIIDRAVVSGAPASGSPQFTSVNQAMSTASWSSGDKAYVLAGVGDETFLRERL